MKIFGLIGKKLNHSFSPAYFEKKFETLGVAAQYKLFEVNDIREVKEIIGKHPELLGLNVTIPYKQDVVGIVDATDEVVEAVGAANTLKIERTEGVIVRAFNTDVIGFEKTLLPLIKGKSSLSALILGTGGAAKSVAYVLNKRNIPYKYVSRNPEENQLAYADLTGDIMYKHHLIINTTPVGMYPHEGEAPDIPYQSLTSRHILYDLIYNPAETLFLKKGRKKGCLTMNGLRMLELQADASWEIWNE